MLLLTHRSQMDQPNKVVVHARHGSGVPSPHHEMFAAAGSGCCNVRPRAPAELFLYIETFLTVRRSQSSAVANTTSTVGYLATITAISSQCLLPRAKFLRIMFFNLLATCIAASICCLASYTAVKARQHSRGSDNSSGHGGISAYNSDACVVSAIWLVVMIWCVH